MPAVWSLGAEMPSDRGEILEPLHILKITAIHASMFAKRLVLYLSLTQHIPQSSRIITLEDKNSACSHCPGGTISFIRLYLDAVVSSRANAIRVGRRESQEPLVLVAWCPLPRRAPAALPPPPSHESVGR